MILTDTSNIYLIYNWSYNWPLCSIFTKSLLIVIVSVCWCIEFCILCVCFVMAVIHEIIYKNEKIHIKGFIIINKFKISNYIQKNNMIHIYCASSILVRMFRARRPQTCIQVWLCSGTELYSHWKWSIWLLLASYDKKWPHLISKHKSLVCPIHQYTKKNMALETS